MQFERNPNFLERWFNADLSERPPIDARKSFQAFQTILERQEEGVESRYLPREVRASLDLAHLLADGMPLARLPFELNVR